MWFKFAFSQNQTKTPFSSAFVCVSITAAYKKLRDDFTQPVLLRIGMGDMREDSDIENPLERSKDNVTPMLFCSPSPTVKVVGLAWSVWRKTLLGGNMFGSLLNGRHNKDPR